MSGRSNRAEVRNPVLGLPDAKLALVELTPDERQRLRRVMVAIRDVARLKAEKCWRKHKGPMALYWKAVGAYANHLARVLR